MKTRFGFVSNSSSSSYVVAVFKKDKCPHCGRTDPNFLDIVEAIGARSSGESECTQLHERGTKEIERYLVEGLKMDEWRLPEEITEWEDVLVVSKKAEKKGYEVARIEISYHDNASIEMMNLLEATGAVKVLWSDHRDINLDKVKL